MTDELTADKARELAHEIAAERPEHVGRSVYREWRSRDATEPPVCLVGHVLDRAGALPKFMSADDKTMSIDKLIDHRFIPADVGARFYLRTLQVRQDSGMAWGEAVEAADRLSGLREEVEDEIRLEGAMA